MYSIDNNAFHGDNDLQVSVASQLGGLKSNVYRQPGDLGIPDHGEIYPNAVHASILAIADPNAFGELKSPQIQHDVVSLLNSPNSKFADSIGVGSLCRSPQ